jgi:cardiolipin synthase A/B
MIATFRHSLLAVAFITLLELMVMVRILLRPHRDPASRIAWVVVVAALPLVGMFAYLLLGEVNIGRGRVKRLHAVLKRMEQIPCHASGDAADDATAVPERYRQLFSVGHSISGFHPVGGNTARLLPNSNATIDAMVADIDSATDHVHVLFYIWLPDHNGTKIIEALKRAAGRIDLRNHRKIVVIDDRITYCGSQNCADAEFRVKAKYAPWVDAVMRFEGPIARQNQFLFASDWMTYVDENLDQFLSKSMPMPGGLTAQVIGTGPTVRYSAMPEMFESLMFAARQEIVATTPYYVPDDSLHNALCTAAYRGVDTTIVFPARNDSWFVGAASRSYYADLLNAGVKIYEYKDGLLHTKSLTVDREVTLIGSANMDRRSFELNYENNILFHDSTLTGAMRERQQEYVARSNRISKEAVAAWPTSRQLWNNLIATLGPVL